MSEHKIVELCMYSLVTIIHVVMFAIFHYSDRKAGRRLPRASTFVNAWSRTMLAMTAGFFIGDMIKQGGKEHAEMKAEKEMSGSELLDR